jgi:predicted AAA+ superfamily ATPase
MIFLIFIKKEYKHIFIDEIAYKENWQQHLKISTMKIK